MVLHSLGSLQAAILQDWQMQQRGGWLQRLGPRWAVLRPTPCLSRPPPTTSDFSQSPKYLGIFRRCWQHNRSTPCTQQTRIPCEEQQAPLNSWAIWSHLKPQILKQKTSFFFYYYYYLFCKLIKALELKGEPQKKHPNPLKQIFATDTRWRRQVFLGEGQNNPALVLTATDLVSHINKLLFASSI